MQLPDQGGTVETPEESNPESAQGRSLSSVEGSGVSAALIHTGNAVTEGLEEGRRGWFLGHFLDPEAGLRHSRDVEVKWGVHPQGEEKTSLAANRTATTLSILVSGGFRVVFPEQGVDITLSAPGDYVLFAPGVAHTWQAVEDTVIISVRWPSQAGDQTAVDEGDNHE